MASYSTNEFRNGLKIILDGEPYSIVENEFVKPGKGQAFNRVRVRNLNTGRVIERTFKSGGLQATVSSGTSWTPGRTSNTRFPPKRWVTA